MQINLIDLLWIALIVLIIAGIVALFQLALILFDIRQVTKGIRRIASAVNFFERCFDGEEAKKFFKKCRRACFSFLEFIVGSLRSLVGGEKK